MKIFAIIYMLLITMVTDGYLQYFWYLLLWCLRNYVLYCTLFLTKCIFYSECVLLDSVFRQLNRLLFDYGGIKHFSTMYSICSDLAAISLFLEFRNSFKFKFNLSSFQRPLLILNSKWPLIYSLKRLRALSHIAFFCKE